MDKVTGIKSVDFKIKSSGHGVVNWNGPTTLEAIINGKRKSLNNHSLPKLRGYTNIENVKKSDGEEYERFKLAEEINFKETPLYISQNCIRYHLFKDDIINWQHPEIHNHVDAVLCSMTGLMRGYVIPKNENKRTSPLLLTDFTEQTGQGNYEQLGRSGSKEKQKTKSGGEASNALFSKTTFGDTEYEAFGSINIEQLQFISLSNAYGQEAIEITTDKEGKELAQKIEEYIKSLDYASGNIQAEYSSNWIRKGTIFADGQKGILLNESAIDTLIKQTLSMIENLSFTQAKGYMSVDSLEVDYNDFTSAKNMFRVKDGSEVNSNKNTEYAIYFKKED